MRTTASLVLLMLLAAPAQAGVLDRECLAAGGRAASDGSKGEVSCRTLVEEQTLTAALARGARCIGERAGDKPDARACPPTSPAPAGWWDAWGRDVTWLVTGGLFGLLAGAAAF